MVWGRRVRRKALELRITNSYITQQHVPIPRLTSTSTDTSEAAAEEDTPAAALARKGQVCAIRPGDSGTKRRMARGASSSTTCVVGPVIDTFQTGEAADGPWGAGTRR